jgi:hypothetical protein
MLWKALILGCSAALALVSTATLFAGGDQNANNNPKDDPPSDTYREPNVDHTRRTVVCVERAEEEDLWMAPEEEGFMEVTCQTVE